MPIMDQCLCCAFARFIVLLFSFCTTLALVVARIAYVYFHNGHVYIAATSNERQREAMQGKHGELACTDEFIDLVHNVHAHRAPHR